MVSGPSVRRSIGRGNCNRSSAHARSSSWLRKEKSKAKVQFCPLTSTSRGEVGRKQGKRSFCQPPAGSAACHPSLALAHPHWFLISSPSYLFWLFILTQAELEPDIYPRLAWNSGPSFCLSLSSNMLSCHICVCVLIVPFKR